MRKLTGGKDIKGDPNGPDCMGADGSNKRIVIDSVWEGSMPLLIPAKFLR